MQLQLGLVADVLEGRRRHPLDPCAAWLRAELGERRDSRVGEPGDLVSAHVRDADEVILLIPPRIAELEKIAEIAVRDRVRLRVRRVVHEREKALAHAAVVGEEVVDAIRLALAGAELDVHALRHASGDAPDLLGVEAKLEHVRRLAVTRELGVEGLVGAVRLKDDEVREPPPLAVDERGLVDHLAAGAHGVLGLASGALPIPVADVDRDDVASVRDQLLEVDLLVLLALPSDERSLRILCARLNPLTASDLEFEPR